MMHIAYLCADRGIPVLGDKGASVHVREFTSALSALGHEVTLFCTKRGSGNPCPPVRLVELPPVENEHAIDAEAARLTVAPAASDKALRRELSKLAHDRGLPSRVLEAIEKTGSRPDVLYERYALFHRAGRTIADVLDIPLVLEVNAPLVTEQERFRELRLKTLADTIESEVWCRADHVVAVSEAVREFALGRGVPDERITVLPNGVDTARFHSGVDGRNVRERLGLVGRPVIAFVGSLKPWHGVDFLLEAFALIRRRIPEVALLVVGEGPGLADLQARVASESLQDAVILTGRVAHAEVPEYIAAADLTVAPYVAQHGFYFSPLKVVESLAAGRPVVAPKLGQLPALLQDGLTGILYPPGDLAAFVASVAALLGDPARLRTMGRRAAEAAGVNFSWANTARRAAALMADSRQIADRR